MFHGKWQRRVAAVSLAAIVQQVAGCATTDRFLLNPQPRPLVAVAVFTDRGGVVYDQPGATIDPAAGTVTGQVNGKGVTVSLRKSSRLQLRDQRLQEGLILVNPRPLLEGERWAPDGRARSLALASGQIVDVRSCPVTVEAPRRLVRWERDGVVMETPFEEITYVQTRDAHPGRTVALVLGCLTVAGLVAAAIAINSMDLSIHFQQP